MCFSMARAIKANRQRNIQEFTKVEHPTKTTASLGQPVHENEKCAYGCNKGKYNGIH